MKPVYANFFGVHKTQNADGDVLELTLKNAQHILEEGNITQERGNTTC